MAKITTSKEEETKNLVKYNRILQTKLEHYSKVIIMQELDQRFLINTLSNIRQELVTVYVKTTPEDRLKKINHVNNIINNVLSNPQYKLHTNLKDVKITKVVRKNLGDKYEFW